MNLRNAAELTGSVKDIAVVVWETGEISSTKGG